MARKVLVRKRSGTESAEEAPFKSVAPDFKFFTRGGTPRSKRLEDILGKVNAGDITALLDLPDAEEYYLEQYNILEEHKQKLIRKAAKKLKKEPKTNLLFRHDFWKYDLQEHLGNMDVIDLQQKGIVEHIDKIHTIRADKNRIAAAMREKARLEDLKRIERAKHGFDLSRYASWKPNLNTFLTTQGMIVTQPPNRGANNRFTHGYAPTDQQLGSGQQVGQRALPEVSLRDNFGNPVVPTNSPQGSQTSIALVNTGQGTTPANQQHKYAHKPLINQRPLGSPPQSQPSGGQSTALTMASNTSISPQQEPTTGAVGQTPPQQQSINPPSQELSTAVRPQSEYIPPINNGTANTYGREAYEKKTALNILDAEIIELEYEKKKAGQGVLISHPPLTPEQQHTDLIKSRKILEEYGDLSVSERAWLMSITTGNSPFSSSFYHHMQGKLNDAKNKSIIHIIQLFNP